jgi:hypothetical protein
MRTARDTLAAVLAGAFLASLLAGCSSPPAAPAPAPEPVAFGREQAAEFRIGWGNDCTTAACTFDTHDRDMPRFRVERNETLSALDLVLEAVNAQPPETTVHVDLLCDPTAGPECPKVAEADGPLPLAVALTGLSVPAGAVLEVSAYLRNGTLHQPLGGTTTDIPRQLAQGMPQARATLRLSGLRDPRPPPPLVPVAHTEVIEADVLCVGSFHNPPKAARWGCGFFSGPTYYPYQFPGSIVSAQATLEWTPSSPLTERLALAGRCLVPADTGEPCAGLPDVQAAGPSPLTLRMDGWAEPQAGVTWYAGPEDDGQQTPQPYRLTVDFTVLEEPPTEKDR